MTNGHIQFTVLGGVESLGGALNARQDENSVEFSGRHADEFRAIRDHVERVITERSRGTASAPIDVADQIRKLAQLRDDGLLTEEEYQAQKQKLL